MIPRIKSVRPVKGYLLELVFDDGTSGSYDVNEDIEMIKSFEPLKTVPGLFEQVKLDESRTCLFWNEEIDLPSDGIYECLR